MTRASGHRAILLRTTSVRQVMVVGNAPIASLWDIYKAPGYMVYDPQERARSKIDTAAAAGAPSGQLAAGKIQQRAGRVSAFNCGATVRDIATTAGLEVCMLPTTKTFAWEERRLRKINIALLKSSSYVIVVNPYLKSNDFNRFR
jgi:hypothetical protein